MIIAISGSVGSGKTTVSKELSKKLNYKILHLNDLAKEFKIKDVKELQTFDFNIDGLVAKVNREIADGKHKNTIIEGHFAHFLNPELVDYLFIINRDLNELREEYDNRGYNEQKIKDNLEVESFNLCFYEGIEEGYTSYGDVGLEIGIVDFDKKEKKSGNQIFCINNNGSILDLVSDIIKKVK